MVGVLATPTPATTTAVAASGGGWRSRGRGRGSLCLSNSCCHGLFQEACLGCTPLLDAVQKGRDVVSGTQVAVGEGGVATGLIDELAHLVEERGVVSQVASTVAVLELLEHRAGEHGPVLLSRGDGQQDVDAVCKAGDLRGLWLGCCRGRARLRRGLRSGLRNSDRCWCRGHLGAAPELLLLGDEEAHAAPEVVLRAADLGAALVRPGLVEGAHRVGDVLTSGDEALLVKVVEAAGARGTAVAGLLELADVLQEPLGVLRAEVGVALLLGEEELLHLVVLALVFALVAVVVEPRGVAVTVLAVDGGAAAGVEVHRGGDLGVGLLDVRGDGASEGGDDLGAVGHRAVEPEDVELVAEVVLKPVESVEQGGRGSTATAAAADGVVSRVRRHEGRK